MSWQPDICIYHANCADGLGAAWAVWMRWPDLTFIPAAYGDAPPAVTGKHVLMVDFSYKRPVIEQMSAAARSIVILDHHKTADAELAGINRVVGGSPESVARIFTRVGGHLANVLVEFHLDKSGSTIAWHFCHSAPLPSLLLYIEDRDLWLFRLPDSRAISAAISCHATDFQSLSALNEEWWNSWGFESLVRQGYAILKKQDKDIRDLLAVATRSMVISGFTVPVANVPFMWASDAGNILAVGNRFSATYFDRADGQRSFSLRSDSDGLDVSEIAANYGGGGHKHAAGFQRPIGWEGDA